MTPNKTTSIAAVAALLALGGCGYIGADESFPHFGESVAHNNQVHIINPDPASAADTAIPGDGARAALAQGRYRRGEVIEPQGLQTSKIKISNK